MRRRKFLSKVDCQNLFFQVPAVSFCNHLLKSDPLLHHSLRIISKLFGITCNFHRKSGQTSKGVKAIGNVGKTGFKKGKEGEKIAKSSQVKQTKAKNKGESGSKVDTVSGSGSGTKKVNTPKNVERQAKKLSPEAKKGYEKAIKALESGDTRGLNDHPLSGNRSGQRAIDIKGTGKGRGAGRIIYEFGEDGEINIIEILTDHKY